MKLKIIGYNSSYTYYTCLDEQDATRFVFLSDLLTDDNYINEDSLIGRTVEVESLIPFSEIAVNVRLVDEVDNTTK